MAAILVTQLTLEHNVCVTPAGLVGALNFFTPQIFNPILFHFRHFDNKNQVTITMTTMPNSAKSASRIGSG